MHNLVKTLGILKRNNDCCMNDIVNAFYVFKYGVHSTQYKRLFVCTSNILHCIKVVIDDILNIILIKLCILIIIDINNSGILRDKTIDVELMYIPNDDKQNYKMIKLNQVLKQTHLRYQCNLLSNVPSLPVYYLIQKELNIHEKNIALKKLWLLLRKIDWLIQTLNVPTC